MALQNENNIDEKIEEKYRKKERRKRKRMKVSGSSVKALQKVIINKT